ncbi:hypothetical protein O6H91_12G073500 [Diphasiastrum complanatum]|uniref:Uncharacterized protein n=1 Tax=Diphasiastrum complanatum TaxID=34168 RepID=A0ACC2C3C2_DIPCM|nr:hypothetical protein O6H91_12G073500 [Diphasiastrum complanatum]
MQVCELHRLYNVQKVLMAETTKKSYDILNISTSHAQPGFLQPSSSSILNLRERSSLWGPPINTFVDSSRCLDKTQPLFPHSRKTAKVGNNATLDTCQERSDLRKAASSSRCRKKLDLERLPDEDLDDDSDGMEGGQQLEEGFKIIDGSCSISNTEGSRCDEPSNISLCLSSGWGSTVKQEMKQSVNLVSSVVAQEHSGDTLKSLKQLRSFEETLAFPLFPKIETSIPSLSKAPQEAPNGRWVFNLEKLPDSAKSNLHNDQIRNEELLKQERKLFDTEADENLAKKINTQPHWLSQGSPSGSKELERSFRLSSQAASLLPAQRQANGSIAKLRDLHSEQIMAVPFPAQRNGNLVGTKLMADEFLAAADRSMISFGPCATAPSIYTDTGSTRVPQKKFQLSSDLGHTKLWMDTEGHLKYDTHTYDHIALTGRSRDSEERPCLPGHGISILDTNLSVGKGPIQEPTLGLWPEWRKLTELQTSQWQAQQAAVAGQGNLFSKGHAAWQAPRHPVPSHAYSQVGATSAPSTELASRIPESLLRNFGNRESFLPHLTLSSASPPPKPSSVKAACQSLSQHKAEKELSSLSSESEWLDPSFQGVVISNGILEDNNKAVKMQIEKSQKLESRRDCSGQTPKVNTKEDHSSKAVKEAVNNTKALDNHCQGDAFITQISTHLEAKDNSQFGHNLHNPKDCREAISPGVGPTSFVSSDSEGAYKQDKAIELVYQEENQQFLTQPSFQDTSTSLFMLKDKENKLLLPSFHPSTVFHDERKLLRGLKNRSQSFTHTDMDDQEKPVKAAEPALQMKLSHVRDPFNGREISHESSSLLKPKMVKRFEEYAQLRSTENSEDVIIESNQVNSSDKLEPGALHSLQSFAAGLINAKAIHIKASEWVNKHVDQVIEPLVPEKALSARFGSNRAKNCYHRFSSDELVAESLVKYNQLNLLSREQGGLCMQEHGATSEQPTPSNQLNKPGIITFLKSSLEHENSRVVVSTLQGLEDDAEGDMDNTINVAASTLLSFVNRASSVPKELKNFRELTPPVLKQSVAWFANAIPEDAEFQKYQEQGTAKSNSEIAIPVSPPECGIVPLKVTSPMYSDKPWNESSNKEFLRFLSRTLNADINKDCALYQKTDSYEAMTLALKPSIVNLDSVSQYMPERFENKSDLHVGKDTRNRTSKRGKRKKDFQSEILPSISSLSRQEIKEDIQTLSKVAKLVRENVRHNSVLTRTSMSSLHEGEAPAPAARRRVAKVCTMTNVHRVECAATSNVALQMKQSNFEDNGAPSCKVDAAEPPYSLGTWRDLTRRRRMQRSRRHSFVENQ